MTDPGLLASMAPRLTRRINLKPARVRFDRPVASFSFDDFPKSAWTAGGSMFAERGLRATFYASGAYAGARREGVDYYDRDDLRAVAAAGHEVGCHGFGHLRAVGLPLAAFDADLARNAAFLDETLGDGGSRTFAWPYGEATLAAKRVVGRRYRAARGVLFGINRGVVDQSELRSVPLERRRSAERAEAAIAAARRANGWIIFFTHDVSPAASPYGVSPDRLARLLDQLLESGFEIAPVGEVAQGHLPSAGAVLADGRAIW